LPDVDKKQLVSSLIHRYESIEKNKNIFLRKLSIISNDVTEFFEKSNNEEINF
jgi:hypothetical protein